MAEAFLPISAAILAAFMVLGAWLDARRRLLPNMLCLSTALAGALILFLEAGWDGLGSASIHAAIALAAGMVFYRLGMVGGGDAKFYAATAVWFPLGAALKLLLSVSIGGALLLVLWHFVKRSGLLADANGKRTGDFAKLPYGVAIAAGAIAARLPFH